MKEKNRSKNVLLYIAGLLFCTVPVLVAIFSYFPLWRDAGGGRVISGAALLLIALAWVPLIRVVKGFFATAAAYMMWLVVFVLFFMLSRIADEMTVISFVGFVGNAIGAVLFKLSGMKAEEREKK